MSKQLGGIELLFDGASGIYIPQRWAEECADVKGWAGFDSDDVAILRAGPDHEWYWETWDDILGNATFTDDRGYEYRMTQDGDVFVYCEKLMTLEEKHNFGFDIRQEIDDILEANEGFDVKEIAPFTWVWTSVEGDSKKSFINFEAAALDCIAQNGLQAYEDVHTAPLFPAD